MNNDWINANKRLNIAIRQFSILTEKRLLELYRAGNPFSLRMLHQIYYRRSFMYRLKYHARQFISKVKGLV